MPATNYLYLPTSSGGFGIAPPLRGRHTYDEVKRMLTDKSFTHLGFANHPKFPLTKEQISEFKHVAFTSHGDSLFANYSTKQMYEMDSSG